MEGAFAFADHLLEARPGVPWPAGVVHLDLGLLRGRLDGAPCTVELHTDPTALLTDLGAGRFPAASGSALSTTAYPLTPTGPGRGASRS